MIFDLVSYEDAITKEVGLKRDGVHKAIVTFGGNPKNDNSPSSLRFWDLWEF